MNNPTAPKTPNEWLGKVWDQPFPNQAAESDAKDRAIRHLSANRLSAFNRYNSGRAVETRTVGLKHADHADGLTEDTLKIAKPLEAGEPLTDEMVDAWKGLTDEAVAAENSLDVDARNLDRIGEVLARPFDAYNRLYEKFPILAQRGFAS